MTNFTDITVLLDRSGSMSSIKSAMESGFDEFVNEHKAIPSTRLTLIQFDTSNYQDVIYTAKPIKDVPGLDLTPRGGTPLLDSLCQAIDNTGSRLRAMRESTRPSKVLFVIITDGQENASKEFKREDVKKRVTKQSGDYNWQFVYLGANQDAFAEAATFGIQPGMTMWYNGGSNAATQNMMRGMATNTVNYALNQSQNATVPVFTNEQRAESATTDTNTTTK